MNGYRWTETAKDDEGQTYCTFCVEEVQPKPCRNCERGDHNYHPFVRQDGDNKPVQYNVKGNEDHCVCCHLHSMGVTDDEVKQTLASIRDAARDASSRGVVSPSGRKG